MSMKVPDVSIISRVWVWQFADLRDWINAMLSLWNLIRQGPLVVCALI